MRNKGRAVSKKQPPREVIQSTFVSDHGNKFYTRAEEVKLSLFQSSDDWQLQFDVDLPKEGQSKDTPFPPHIATTRFRPDGIFWSDKLKTVVWIELTSPFEENMEKWHFEKHNKYNKVAIQARDSGWTVHPLCVEVGARGYVNHKWRHMCKTLDMTNRESKQLQTRVSQTARRCSYFLYLSRKNEVWVQRPLLDGYADD